MSTAIVISVNDVISYLNYFNDPVLPGLYEHSNRDIS